MEAAIFINMMRGVDSKTYTVALVVLSPVFVAFLSTMLTNEAVICVIAMHYFISSHHVTRVGRQILRCCCRT